jgi:hypothetical protein
LEGIRIAENYVAVHGNLQLGSYPCVFTTARLVIRGCVTGAVRLYVREYLYFFSKIEHLYNNLKKLNTNKLLFRNSIFLLCFIGMFVFVK